MNGVELRSAPHLLLLPCMERRRISDRRTLLGGGRRDIDVQPNDRNGCIQMAQQVARLRTAVETIAPALQQQAEAFRALVDAIQGLTAQRHKPQ